MADSPTRDAASTHGANLRLNCGLQGHRDPQMSALSPSKAPAATKASCPSPKPSPGKSRVTQRDKAGGRAQLGIRAVPITWASWQRHLLVHPRALPGSSGVLSRTAELRIASPLHAKCCRQLCRLPPAGLTTSAFKKKHSINHSASKTGTWTLRSQSSVHGVRAGVTLSQGHSQEAFSFLRSWETHQKHCGESGLFAQTVADNSAGGYSLSGSGGRDLAQEEQEQSLAKGRAAELRRPGAEVTCQEATVAPR